MPCTYCSILVLHQLCESPTSNRRAKLEFELFSIRERRKDPAPEVGIFSNRGYFLHKTKILARKMDISFASERRSLKPIKGTPKSQNLTFSPGLILSAYGFLDPRVVQLPIWKVGPKLLLKFTRTKKSKFKLQNDECSQS